MQLLTEELKKAIPPLYSQEKVKDPMVYAKFFTPKGALTWFVTEFSHEDNDTCFGYILDTGEGELGYFSLQFLQEQQTEITIDFINKADQIHRIAIGNPIPVVERDTHFKPVRLSEAKATQLRNEGFE